MTDTTLTLALDGEIPLTLFTEAMRHWQNLLTQLAVEVAGDSDIAWVIEDLEVGSAVATVRGESTDLELVNRVVHAYEGVGRALSQEQRIPYSTTVAREAHRITALLNGKITSIRFQTPNEESIISNRLPVAKRASLRAYGAIEGRVQTLTSRQALRFTLFDAVHDKAVMCWVAEGREELLRDIWDRRALVEGIISRDPLSGRPTAIRQIERITPVDDVPPGTYRLTRGIAPPPPGSMLPEDAVRMVRDG